jgi:uncharacterized protein HemX
VSATGEQPAAERAVSNSTPVALGLAIAALVGVLGAGIAWGDARSRLGTVEENAVELKARVQRAEDATNVHAVRDAALETKVESIQTTVQGMDRKLDRVLEQRRGVTRAGGPE